MAQLVARYLGVVEAAGSSPVTQTNNGYHFCGIRFCFLKAVFAVNSAFSVFEVLMAYNYLRLFI